MPTKRRASEDDDADESLTKKGGTSAQQTGAGREGGKATARERSS